MSGRRRLAQHALVTVPLLSLPDRRAQVRRHGVRARIEEQVVVHGLLVLRQPLRDKPASLAPAAPVLRPAVEEVVRRRLLALLRPLPLRLRLRLRLHLLLVDGPRVQEHLAVLVDAAARGHEPVLPAPQVDAGHLGQLLHAGQLHVLRLRRPLQQQGGLAQRPHAGHGGRDAARLLRGQGQRLALAVAGAAARAWGGARGGARGGALVLRGAARGAARVAVLHEEEVNELVKEDGTGAVAVHQQEDRVHLAVRQVGVAPPQERAELLLVDHPIPVLVRFPELGLERTRYPGSAPVPMIAKRKHSVATRSARIIGWADRIHVACTNAGPEQDSSP
mmetsp:Transcript_69576/g.203618  ORF Transcript_69576/g.203618 Transcript_69576/m.203618 type:complete len:334 (-) Transcript_69576:67-1068(-)